MSNLGRYQTITTVAKSLGGPEKLVVVIGVGGYCLLRAGEAGVKQIVKTVKALKHTKQEKAKEFLVQNKGIDEQGLELMPGEIIRILGRDGDAILIEKVGSELENNPYFVSVDFLRQTLGMGFGES